MPPSRIPLTTPLDPEGHYARLGVEPWCPREAITAAWRREARIVHPDVPETGDAVAFLALKRAYDVLSHGDRRAAYDRSARQPLPQGREPGPREPGTIDPTPFPEMAQPITRHPRLRDLPTAVWAGMVVILMIGVVEVGLHLTSSPTQDPRPPILATAPNVPPLAPAEAARLPYGAAPVRLAGTPNFYISPSASAAMLWKVDEAQHILVPWAQLPSFSAVQAVRLLKPSGMVEVKVTDAANGYVDAVRLTPGNVETAARAWCTYNAGPTPSNGEVLSRAVKGRGRLEIENRSGQLAVVKFRSTAGAVVASVFVDPGGETTMDALPDQPVHIEFATGEVWSRACRGFAAGMRARRLSELITLDKAPRLSIPPEAAVATVEIPDQAFEQE